MPLMSTKLRNRFTNENPMLEVSLSNIRINGQARGCSGFITDPQTGRVVYVNTEGSEYSPLAGKIMYRTAKDAKDYRGGMNHWSTDADIVSDVLALLSK